VVGDPTEGALLVAARKAGLDERTLQKLFPRLDEIPFDSARQYMATLHEIEGVRLAYFKGALEQLLPRSLSMLDRAKGLAMPLRREEIEAAARSMAAAGLRVLAVARLAAGAAKSLEAGQCRRRAAVHRSGRHGRSAPPESHRRRQDLPRRRHHGQDDHRRPCRHGAVDRPPTRDCQGRRTALTGRELARWTTKGCAAWCGR
jgi:hypothetical protein